MNEAKQKKNIFNSNEFIQNADDTTIPKTQHTEETFT